MKKAVVDLDSRLAHIIGVVISEELTIKQSVGNAKKVRGTITSLLFSIILIRSA
jgi:hypothetical protein